MRIYRTNKLIPLMNTCSCPVIFCKTFHVWCLYSSQHTLHWSIFFPFCVSFELVRYPYRSKLGNIMQYLSKVSKKGCFWVESYWVKFPSNFNQRGATWSITTAENRVRGEITHSPQHTAIEDVVSAQNNWWYIFIYFVTMTKLKVSKSWTYDIKKISRRSNDDRKNSK